MFALDAPAGVDASLAKAVANGLRLDGATIRGAHGTDAVLVFGTAPGVSTVAVAADGDGDGAWSVGEAVAVTLTFAEPVEVDTTGGTPALGVVLGGGAVRQASYTSGSGTDALVFSYLLVDADGTVSSVAVPANGLALNGGAIRSTAGLAAELSHPGAQRMGESPSPAQGLSVADASVAEGDGARLVFEVTLTPAASVPVTVGYRTYDGTAVANEDYVAVFGIVGFAAGETRKSIEVLVLDDGHDEGTETLTLTLSNASGAAIGDGEATGRIHNRDPMPRAWLARYGRTVAEQALAGVSGRMRAPRAAGFEGSLGGHALTFGAGSAPVGDWMHGDAALDRTGTHGGALPGDGSSPGLHTSFDTGLGGTAGAGEVRTLSAHELLLGSTFTLTGAEDSSGGSMAFWGRGAETRFDGREDTLDLDGTVTTGMLGADYARERWMVGFALMRSEGEGGYAERSASGSADIKGTIETSLTAAVPYGAWRASERLSVWGAAGFGAGEMTLEPEGGTAIETDLDWSMAAAGMRSELLAPPDSGAGPGLALTADALWASTSSDEKDGLMATESDVTRLRLGLEGSWTVALEGGGRFVPRLEVGARHDDGDAETGTGVDLGGGLAWSAPGVGLSLEVEGRTLLAHGADGLKDRGFAASLVFDPAPSTQRGLSFGLRQDWGGRATGGIDALFATDPLSERNGTGAAEGRWTAEAAYGFAAFGGGFTASPHVGFGLSSDAREYRLGWKVTPERPTASTLSFGLEASRHESAGADPEHRVGFELTTRW